MKRFVCLLLMIACLQVKASAQNSFTSADIYLGLKKLNVLGSVLYVAAHPDDENTRLITYFSKEKLYRTGYLSMTRGDGGQNLIGEEQGIELGLIRTQELMAARRIDGGEQFFTRAYDFGYSKTPSETFNKWDKEKILADVVWVIRKFRPDVIITRFPSTGEGGHGHHTGSAILANEAFSAAADPNRFPEQLKYVEPWQAKRIVWNGFNFGNATPPEDAFTIDVGGYNAVLGKNYGEIAAQSRSQHKSQGFGASSVRGEAFEYFRLTGGPEMRNDLFDDVNTSWSRVNGGEKIQDKINEIINQYDFTQPDRSVPALVELYRSLQSLPGSYWRNRKLKEVQDLVEAASGLWIEAYTTTPYAVQEDSIRLNFVVNSRLNENAVLNWIQGTDSSGFVTAKNVKLPKNKNYSTNISVKVHGDITQPYWIKEKMNPGSFNVNNQQLIGEPDVEPAMEVLFQINIGGQAFVFKKPVQYKYTHPVRGELYQPLAIIPSATLVTSPEVVLFKQGKDSKANVHLQVRANKKIRGFETESHIRSSNFDTTKTESSLVLEKLQSKDFNFVLESAEMKNQEVDHLYGSVHYRNDSSDHTAYLAHRSINYDHIHSINYFFADAVTLLNMDLKTYGKKIGYITGAGDKVPEALEQMGYEVVLLTDKELERNNLEQYDAIISGIRAYNTNEWLNLYYPKLMKYVHDGGNLIVQYNTSSNLGPVKARIGPYPFSISRSRITDENAEVRFLQPGHQVLNFPNKITAKDFEGWIQERSIYHASNFDTSFQPIFQMNDPGENGNDGSLIISKYGKGYFTYTGLVFFRQLPAAVPGAYRLIANLIALNRKKEF